MCLWSFDIYWDGVMKEVRARVVEAESSLVTDDENWKVLSRLYADDDALLAHSEKYLLRVVSELDRACRRYQRVNVVKNSHSI